MRFVNQLILVDPGELEQTYPSGGNGWLLGILIFLPMAPALEKRKIFVVKKKTHFFLTIFGKNRSFGVAEWLFNKILGNFLRGFSQHFLTHKKSDLLGTRSRDSISKNIARMGQVGKP